MLYDRTRSLNNYQKYQQQIVYMANNTTSIAQRAQGSSLSQFFTTLISAAVIAAIQILLFILIRTCFKRIYAPKTYLVEEERRVKPLPKSLLGWLPVLLRMPQEDLIRTSGLDAYFFARYLYVHGLFFLCSFVILAIILFPIYAVRGKGEPFGKQGLDLLTFGNIAPEYSSRYGAPLVLAYVFIGTFLCILYTEMKNFVKKRQALLRSTAHQSHASATTILIIGIPKSYMSYSILQRIFEKFPGGIRHIWLNRNLKDILSKANERMKLVEQLETTLCKLIRNVLKKQKTLDIKENNNDPFNRYIPEKKRPTLRIGRIPLLSSLCFGTKVDTISHCKQKISQLNTELDEAKESLDAYPVLNSAFIQFNEQIAAHIAAQSVASSIPLTMTPRYIDVKPANIVWSNLNLTFYEIRLRRLLSVTLTTILIVFWAIPVAFVGILSNLTYLTNKLTFLQFIYNLPAPLLGIITGLLPTILLAILMALLPIVLKLLAKLSGIPTTDAIDRHVQSSYFIFQVVHVFLVVTISSSFSSVIVDIIQNPTSAASILAANIPTASNFFLSFLALQGLSVASGVLLQIGTLILFYLLGKLFDNTPRKIARRYFTLSSLSWGTLFPIFTNFVVITIAYSIISPLMLLIAGLAFFLFYIAYLYSMFYVSDFPNDSGGLAFSRAIYQSFIGIYLMEILMAGLFLLAQNERGSQSAIAQGILMCVLILITIGVHWTMCSSFDPLTYYLPVDVDEYDKLKSRKTIPNMNTVTRDNCNMEDAYLHPAIRDPRPIIWLPQDRLNIAEDEVRRTSLSGLNLSVSIQGARFNEKNKIEVDSPAPDAEHCLNEDSIQTRF